MEKQYICQYCGNRFKNKNEAERHQNSLHLRRHSWSCSALTSFESAFYPTPSNPLATPIGTSSTTQIDKSPSENEAAGPSNGYQASSDTCGYCGQTFTNPPNWDDRVEHLNNVHKFGECNQSKRFYRADHFRQHLKHSHGGTSGKWTNVLENACMKDEPMPQPMNPLGMLGASQPGIIMLGQQQLMQAGQGLEQMQRMQQQLQAQQAQAQQQAQAGGQVVGGHPLAGSPPHGQGQIPIVGLVGGGHHYPHPGAATDNPQDE